MLIKLSNGGYLNLAGIASITPTQRTVTHDGGTFVVKYQAGTIIEITDPADVANIMAARSL